MRALASWIPESHNTPGFPNGLGGPELLTRLTQHAAQFGAEVREARADTLACDGKVFEVSTSAGALRGRSVLLATAVTDRMPAFDGLEAGRPARQLPRNAGNASHGALTPVAVCRFELPPHRRGIAYAQGCPAAHSGRAGIWEAA